jgi:hypothetical protein
MHCYPQIPSSSFLKYMVHYGYQQPPYYVISTCSYPPNLKHIDQPLLIHLKKLKSYFFESVFYVKKQDLQVDHVSQLDQVVL